MAHLIIDIGNTHIKAAIFNDNSLLKFEYYTTTDIQQLETFTAGHIVNKGIIASVKNERYAWEDELAMQLSLTYFNREMAGQIKNHYLTPQTLGLDRLAAIMGAQCLYQGTGSLVIDAGTCIKYDYVDAESNYYGGNISPGLNMRFKAMHDQTSALPLLNADEDFEQNFGTDTAGAMLSGVQNGIKHELNGFIESYKNSRQVQQVILTGGNGIFFDRLLKNSIFAPYIKNEPYLVLYGLNAAIQQHND